MSNESSQPSTPLNSAVDLSVVRVLRVLDPIARSSRCEYFLAGATARDLILVNVHGLRPGAPLAISTSELLLRVGPNLNF